MKRQVDDIERQALTRIANSLEEISETVKTWPFRVIGPARMVRKPEPDAPLVTVCAECLRACCWQGEFMCEEARSADTVEKTRDELRKLKREDESWWAK